MSINEVCFIICSNQADLYQNAQDFISKLSIPQGFKVKGIVVSDAQSITSAYNKAMNSSGAKYNIYLHQDTLIINKNFISDIVSLFEKYPRLGMLGVAGCKRLTDDGIWWHGQKFGKVFDSPHHEYIQYSVFEEVLSDYESVEAIDGLIMVTQYDLPWREDVFDGWHFYDISQSAEFIKAGYEVGIPKQFVPWCIHDCKKSKMDDYTKYQEKFIGEYMKRENESLTQGGMHVAPCMSGKTKEVLFEKKLQPTFLNSEEYSQAKQTLIRSQDQFEQLVREAEAQVLRGDSEQIAQAVEKAAFFATFNHPGVYCSTRLEELLLQCARTIDGYTIPAMNLPEKLADNQKRNVLHVLTEGYETGGHTRLVSRWMGMDKESNHSVVALEPVRQSTPQWLYDTAEKSGGWSCSLYPSNLNLCQRAKVLRHMADSWADVVVLHIHPYDPIATIAFGIDGGLPVVLFNHADHMFWLGVSVADLVINLRSSGYETTLRRRGTRRVAMLPIPLSMPDDSYTKEIARTVLDIDNDSVVLLSIASAYKYAASGEGNFKEMLCEIINAHPHTLALIIGPDNAGEWHEVSKRTNNRIRVLGVQRDVGLYHRAADIYLDSFFLTSLTATLEAAAKGLPVVCLDSVNKLFANDDVSVRKVLNISKDIEAYQENVRMLITQEDVRHRLGQNLARQIKEDHIDKWSELLREVYAQVPEEHVVLQQYETINQWDNGDLLWALLQRKQN